MNEYDSNRIFDITKKLIISLLQKNQKQTAILLTLSYQRKGKEKVFHDVGRVKKEYKNKKNQFLLLLDALLRQKGI